MVKYGNESVQIQFPGNPGWDFNVKFKTLPENEPCFYPQPDKLLAVSDIEGEFEALRSLLVANRVINEHYNWIFSSGHLVICGDIFDRGEYVFECLWLLYKLEEEAKRAGGYVHVILGNHEIMNMSGDLRYVHYLYFDENTTNLNYMDQFSESSHLGKWLRTKNIMEKIGEGLYLHAGISPEVNDLSISIEQANLICREWYDNSRIYLSYPLSLLMGNEGPFWYRGYFFEPEEAAEQIDITLRHYQVRYIVVGHTMVSALSVLFDGKLIALDVDHHNSSSEALYIHNGVFYRAGITGKPPSPYYTHSQK